MEQEICPQNPQNLGENKVIAQACALGGLLHSKTSEHFGEGEVTGLGGVTQ